jgi:hypothetical protein
MRLSFVSSCKLVTKEHRMPETQHIASSHATLFCIILQTCYKRASHPETQHIASSHARNPTHPGTHRIIACDYLLYHLANLLQKSIASQKTNTSVVGNSVLNLEDSPFMIIRQDLEAHFVVQTFDELS